MVSLPAPPLSLSLPSLPIRMLLLAFPIRILSAALPVRLNNPVPSTVAFSKFSNSPASLRSINRAAPTCAKLSLKVSLPAPAFSVTKLSSASLSST